MTVYLTVEVHIGEREIMVEEIELAHDTYFDFSAERVVIIFEETLRDSDISKRGVNFEWTIGSKRWKC